MLALKGGQVGKGQGASTDTGSFPDLQRGRDQADSPVLAAVVRVPGGPKVLVQGVGGHKHTLGQEPVSQQELQGETRRLERLPFQDEEVGQPQGP